MSNDSSSEHAQIPTKNINTIVTQQVNSELIPKIKNKTRIEIADPANNINSYEEQLAKNQTEVIHEMTKCVNSLADTTTITQLFQEGHEATIFAAAISTLNGKENWNLIETHQTDENLRTVELAKRYEKLANQSEREFFNNNIHDMDNSIEETIRLIGKHGKEGGLILILKALTTDNGNNSDFQDKFTNSERTTSDLINTLISSGFLKPEQQNLIQAIDTINHVCEIGQLKKQNLGSIIPNDGVNTKEVYESRGVSQVEIQKTLTSLIEKGQTNTPLFTRLCAGIDYSQLQSELQEYFSNSIISDDIIIGNPIYINDCQEAVLALITDLHTRGISEEEPMWEVPNEVTLTQLPHMASIKLNTWWREDEYLVTDKYILSTNGIMVPATPENDAIYIRRSTDSNNNIVHLPTSNSQYNRRSFSQYTKTIPQQ